jgi:hypothetical protein
MREQKLFKILLCWVVLCIPFFTGCEDDNSHNDLSVSEITIFNIPVQIPIDNLGGGSHNTFKIYLNASDSMDPDKPPTAQAFKKFVKEDGVSLNEGVTRDANTNTYAITMPLRKPIINLKGTPGYDENLDPNKDDGPWSGTALNYSVTIVPKDVTGGADVIWVKGSTGFDKSKARLDWNDNGLMNFRNPDFADPPLSLPSKTKALFEDVVCQDPDLITP